MRTLAAADFVLHPFAPELRPDEIHLWFFPQCELDGSGKPRYNQCLLETLARYLGVAADSLHIQRNAHGKPYLVESAGIEADSIGLKQGSSLQFNLSHSGGALLLAISRSQPLGVDLESKVRPRPYLDIAQRYFTREESAALAALPTGQQAKGFLELWSAKEAVLKALGEGLVFGLDRLSFALDTYGEVSHLVRIAAQGGTVNRWQMLRLAPQPGMIGMLAWHGSPLCVRAFKARRG